MNIGEMTLLQNDSNKQVSPISKGFVETWVNSHPCKGNNLTRWHMWTTKGTRVATFTTTIKELGRVTPFPSVRFPRDTPHKTIRVWPLHYPGMHHYRGGEGSSNSVTIKAIMFEGFHRARMHQYTTQSCSPGPDDWSITNTGGGYHLEAPNLTSVHSQPSHPVFYTTL
jgi:hypothetical protein